MVLIIVPSFKIMSIFHLSIFWEHSLMGLLDIFMFRSDSLHDFRLVVFLIPTAWTHGIIHIARTNNHFLVIFTESSISILNSDCFCLHCVVRKGWLEFWVHLCLWVLRIVTALFRSSWVWLLALLSWLVIAHFHVGLFHISLRSHLIRVSFVH